MHGNVFTGSFPGPLSGRYPGSCEHPPPYASGLGYLVFCEVLRLTPRIIAQRGSFDHAIKWRVLAAFYRFLGVKMPKKSDISAKIRTPYYGVFAVKIFGGFWFL